MKIPKVFFLIFLPLIIFSCKRERSYHIQGTLMNEVTGNSHNMGGETIQLIRIKKKATFNIFANPDERVLEAEAITNNEGHFDFGVNKLKQGDYKIEYLQVKGKENYGVSNSFVDITLENNSAIDETISVIPTIIGLTFFANPLSTSSQNDSIYVAFVSEKRFIQNPNFYTFGDATGHELTNDPTHTIGGINDIEFMGRFFIKIRKSYNGTRTVIYDTVYVEKDARYDYYIPF